MADTERQLIHKRHCSDNRREPAGLFAAGPLQLKQPLQPDMNSADVKHAQILLKGLGFDPAERTAISAKQ